MWPVNAQLAPSVPVTAPAKVFQEPPAIAGSDNPDSAPVSARPATALSKYQFTPYFRSPVSPTSATCASMCTCSGITSSFSITSRIERQACGVERTSNVFVSSTADTPTRSPSTSRLMLTLPDWRCGRFRLPALLPLPLLLPPPTWLLKLLPLLASMPRSPSLPSCDGMAPGASDAEPAPLRLPLLAKASLRRSARSRALM
ncbi:hypothetical protein D3C73_1199960 [compost metagenome]